MRDRHRVRKRAAYPPQALSLCASARGSLYSCAVCFAARHTREQSFGARLTRASLSLILSPHTRTNPTHKSARGWLFKGDEIELIELVWWQNRRSARGFGYAVQNAKTLRFDTQWRVAGLWRGLARGKFCALGVVACKKRREIGLCALALQKKCEILLQKVKKVLQYTQSFWVAKKSQKALKRHKKTH